MKKYLNAINTYFIELLIIILFNTPIKPIFGDLTYTIFRIIYITVATVLFIINIKVLKKED